VSHPFLGEKSLEPFHVLQGGHVAKGTRASGKTKALVHNRRRSGGVGGAKKLGGGGKVRIEGESEIFKIGTRRVMGDREGREHICEKKRRAQQKGRRRKRGLGCSVNVHCISEKII